MLRKFIGRNLEMVIFYLVCAIGGIVFGYTPPSDKLPCLIQDAVAFMLITGPPPSGGAETTYYETAAESWNETGGSEANSDSCGNIVTAGQSGTIVELSGYMHDDESGGTIKFLLYNTSLGYLSQSCDATWNNGDGAGWVGCAVSYGSVNQNDQFVVVMAPLNVFGWTFVDDDPIYYDTTMQYSTAPENPWTPSDSYECRVRIGMQ